MLIQLSFKKRAYQCWKDDEPLDHLLRAVLPGHVVDDAKKKGGKKDAEAPETQASA